MYREEQKGAILRGGLRDLHRIAMIAATLGGSIVRDRSTPFFYRGSRIAPLKLVSETNEREEHREYVPARAPSAMTGPIVSRSAFIFTRQANRRNTIEMKMI